MPTTVTTSAVAATAPSPNGRTIRYSGIAPSVPASPGARGT